MKKHFWRRFRPSNRRFVIKTDPSIQHESDVFLLAEQKMYSSLPRNPHLEKINSLIESYLEIAERTGNLADWVAALGMQSPRASSAQQQMDRHRHGYHNKDKRLYELIDFNDAFVATVLAADFNARQVFSEKMKQICDRICERSRTQKFSEDQWQAIVKGLSREIAVYLGAKSNGFEVTMTSRNQDALGVDIQIRDPESKRYINIDCKTPSAFRYRLEDLAREGRVNHRDILLADRNGYIKVVNGHGNEKVEVIILAVLPDFYGEIVNFEFEDTTKLREKLNILIREFGRSDAGFGEMKEIVVRKR